MVSPRTVTLGGRNSSRKSINDAMASSEIGTASRVASGTTSALRAFSHSACSRRNIGSGRVVTIDHAAGTGQDHQRRLARLEPVEGLGLGLHLDAQSGPARPPLLGILAAERLDDRLQSRVIGNHDHDGFRRSALKGQTKADRENRGKPIDPEDPRWLSPELADPRHVEFPQRAVMRHRAFPGLRLSGSNRWSRPL